LVLGNGSSTGDYGTYTAGTTFKVARAGNPIKFYRNGVQFHSVGAGDEALVGKVAFSGAGGIVEDLALTGPKIDKKLQNVDYRYNIRGWLTDINYVGTYTEGLVGVDNDLFNFRINYNRVEGDATNAPLYNGNIAQTLWKTRSTDRKVRGYAYSYDPLNRIRAAESYRGEDLDNLALTTEYTVDNITYDKNGNIITLARRGADNSPVPSFGQWDDLVYTY